MALPRINKNWILLGLAVVLGLGAMALSNKLLQRRMADLEAEAKRGQETVRVVVANRDMERGDAITSDDLAVRQVPKEWVHSTAVMPGEVGGIERQRLASPVKRGETLLKGHLDGLGATVFSATLKKGQRALTVEVDTVNSINGMLRPGDRIDLIYTGKAKGSDEEMTLPLLSNVNVLATGQTVTRQDDKTGQERSFAAITLELSPRDADRIVVARQGGRLTAVLRHPDDLARNGTQVMAPSSLISGGTVSGRDVEFIVGGGGGIAQSTITQQTAAIRNAMSVAGAGAGMAAGTGPGTGLAGGAVKSTN